MNLIIVLLVVLAIIAIAQLTKVYDLSRTLRNSREEEITPADNRLNANAWVIWMYVFLHLHSIYTGNMGIICLNLLQSMAYQWIA